MPVEKCQSKFELKCKEIWGGIKAEDSGISVPGIDVWVYSQPFEGSTRGGDIHYVSVCQHGALVRMVVADVSGHGAMVAELASKLRSLMRKHINAMDQTELARELNDEFNALGETGRFATALFATYLTPNDHLVICNAAHPCPIWYSTKSREWKLLDPHVRERSEKCLHLPLGVVEHTSYCQYAIPLMKGDMVLLYTDALTETENEDGDFLGEVGLMNIASKLDVAKPEAFGHALLDAIAEFRGTKEVQDDITLMTLYHNAADPPDEIIPTDPDCSKNSAL